MIKGTCQPKNTSNCMGRKRKVSFPTVWLLTFPFFFFFFAIHSFFCFLSRPQVVIFCSTIIQTSFFLFYSIQIWFKQSYLFLAFFLLLKNNILVFGFLFQKQFSIFFVFSKTPTLKTKLFYLDFWESNNEIWFESSYSIAWINY